MKKIEINIGLSSKPLGELNPIKIVNALTGRGFHVLAYRVAPSSSEDGPELCLACRVAVRDTCPWDNVIRDLNKLAVDYGQACIAFTGFAGPDSYETFDPKYWITPEAKPETVSTAQAVIDRIISGLPDAYQDAVYLAAAARYHARNSETQAQDPRP